MIHAPAAAAARRPLISRIFRRRREADSEHRGALILRTQPQAQLAFRQKVSWIPHLVKAALRNHHHDLEETFRAYIPRDGIVIDIGAHAGQFSKLFSRLACDGQVYAVEPSAYALSILKRALKWNRIRNVEVVALALSDVDGWATLHTPLTHRGSMGFGRAGFGEPSASERHLPQASRLQRLDAFCSERGVTRVDFIKADVEGWEAHVLRGGLETLRRFEPTLYMEVSDDWLARAGDAPSDLWDILRPFGYVAQKVELVDGMPSLTVAETYLGPGDYLFVGRRELQREARSATPSHHLRAPA